MQKEIDKISLKYKPISSEDYLKLDTLEKYLDEDGGIMVEPAARFVFKTLDKQGEKIFLNIASHPIIDEPEEKYLVEMEVNFEKGFLLTKKDSLKELSRDQNPHECGSGQGG